jgi:hypothetical protein
MGFEPKNDPKQGGPPPNRGPQKPDPGSPGSRPPPSGGTGRTGGTGRGGASEAPGSGRDTTGEMEDAAGGRRTGPDAPRPPDPPDDPDDEDPFGRSKPATPGKGERDSGPKPGA